MEREDVGVSVCLWTCSFPSVFLPSSSRLQLPGLAQRGSQAVSIHCWVLEDTGLEHPPLEGARKHLNCFGVAVTPQLEGLLGSGASS